MAAYLLDTNHLGLAVDSWDNPHNVPLASRMPPQGQVPVADVEGGS